MTYIIEGKQEEGTKTIFLEKTGYKMNNKTCFYLWNEEDKKKVLFIPSNNWIKRNLTKTV